MHIGSIRRLSALCLVACACHGGEGRFEQLTASLSGATTYRTELATWFGGTGVDELVDAVVTESGTVIAIGNSWGPDFPSEARLSVLGKGAHSGRPAITTPAPSKKKGAPAPKATVDEMSPDRSGFVLTLTPDLSGIAGGFRFDWGVASLASAQLAPDGSLYILGSAGPAFTSLGGVPIRGQGAAFVMKVVQGKPAWIARFGPSSETTRAKRMWQTDEGLYASAIGDKRESVARIAFDGTSEAWVDRPSDDTQSFFAVGEDGVALYGGDRNTHTGKEPWRQPFLYGLAKAGAKRWTWWEWASKDLRKDGHPSYGLVADSSPRNAVWDRHTKAWLVTGWSDGGNSVFGRQPTDVATQVPKQAGPFTTHGMKGANSLAWIMRIDPATAKVAAWTYFMAYVPMDFATERYRGAPNAVTIKDIEVGPRGEVAISGGAATGLIQTPGAFWTYPKDGQKYGGAFGAVLSSDLSKVLFSSYLPGYEHVRVSVGSDRVVLVGRAKRDDERERPAAPPTVAPFQGAIRGERDGHLIVLRRQ